MICLWQVVSRVKVVPLAEENAPQVAGFFFLLRRPRRCIKERHHGVQFHVQPFCKVDMSREESAMPVHVCHGSPLEKSNNAGHFAAPSPSLLTPVSLAASTLSEPYVSGTTPARLHRAPDLCSPEVSACYTLVSFRTLLCAWLRLLRGADVCHPVH